MEELPEGVELPLASVAIPRPSASLIISRINAGREEILLCHRVSEVPAFPDFWAFPGGGVSRVDKEVAEENPDWFAHTNDSILTITLLRELVEEVGFAPNGKGSLELVNEEIQEEVCNDKNAWADLVRKGLLKIENFNSQIIAERTMPPLAPVRYTNTFHHLSIDDSTIEPRFPKGMTEFDEYKWWEPKTLLDTWLRHEVRLPPPQVTLVRDITQAIEDYGELNLAFQKLSENPSKGYHVLEFAPGVECVPLPTQTLPPATHTNCYVLGIAGGERVIVDPAAKSEDALDILRNKVNEIELTGSKIIATIFTHKHPDHIGDLMKISEIYQAPIWASKETLEIIPKFETNKVLKEGDIFELNKEDESVYWKIIETHGHCPGHICLAGDAGIVSGDNVAVIGTILVPSRDGDMNQYLDGLERIKNLNPPLLFPGHGPFSANPQRLLSRYIKHRSKRHQAVYDAVKDDYNTLELIAQKAYEGTPDAHPILLIDQTLSHLKGHIKSGNIRRVNDEYFLK